MLGIVRADTACMALDVLRARRATVMGEPTALVESVYRIRTGDSNEAAFTPAAL
jgi:hypothetical protein